MKATYIIGVTSYFLLAGCNQAQSDSPSGGTMQLLRGGSEKVCVTADVKETLRNILFPKYEMLELDANVADKKAVIELFSLNFNSTTMDSFDKSSSKASCNTALVISGPNGSQSEEFSQEYSISPSSDDASAFVISAPAQAAKAYIIERATAYLHDKASNSIQTQDDSEQETAPIAMVTKNWIVGKWAPDDESVYGCGEILEIEFGADGKFGADRTTGTWKIADGKIYVSSIDSVDNEDNSREYNVTEASDNSFSYLGDDGKLAKMTRCST